MSVDTVDDLHAAEDEIGHLTAALGGLLRLAGGTPKGITSAEVAEIINEARAAHACAVAYCRPSCGHYDTGRCEAGGEEAGCGCPCRHAGEDG